MPPPIALSPANAATTASTNPDPAHADNVQSPIQESKRRRTLSSDSRAPSSAPAMKRPRMTDASAQLQRPIPIGTGKDTMSGFGPRTMRTTVKKLVIKNRRVDGSDYLAEVEKYFDSVWTEVSAALGDILQNKRPKIPFDRIFRDVEDLCRNSKEAEVYKKLISACEKHLSEVVLNNIKSAQKGNDTDTDVLASVLSEWKIWNEKSVCLTRTRPRPQSQPVPTQIRSRNRTAANDGDF